MYLTWCNTVDGYWKIGILETEWAGITSISTGDKTPPSQWQYYDGDSWKKDDATITIEGD